ncbi:MAG: hypothetical protein GY953_31445 [bacterium]|nr:hypothetical protein [bacterium]
MTPAPNGDLYFVDWMNYRVRKISTSGCMIEPRPVVSGIGSSALRGGLTAGSLFSVYGTRLGPEEAAYTQLDEHGRVAKQASGTRVLFNGVASPLTYTQDGQVNGAVPFVLWGRREAELVVEVAGRRSEPRRVSLWPASPGAFGWLRNGLPYAAMINQDGTINGPDSPAALGSVVTIFATGAGQTEPGGVDGQIASPPLPKPIQPVSVEVNYKYYPEVLYAGAAPGMIEGVIQVNFRVPEEERVTIIRLIIGNYRMVGDVYFYTE